jgi:hypothetical protein
MKVLKLTILLEPGLSKAALANVFGDYITLGRQHTFIEFTFSSVNMLSARHLKPIHDLLKQFEQEQPLRYKMFYLHDAAASNYSPIAIHCDSGKWFTVSSASGAEMNKSESLFGLF